MDIISSLTMQIILKIENFITNPILVAAWMSFLENSVLF